MAGQGEKENYPDWMFLDSGKTADMTNRLDGVQHQQRCDNPILLADKSAV